jgi:hypothetical protein
MAADLLSRLLLDTKQFDDNIKKSKQQIQQFQNTAKAVGTALKTFAVALIGIETAAQAFNKVIRGSQGISDEYDKVMRAATTTVDNFFASLTTGDFSVFDRGISNIIAKAREAQAALDQLGNTTMSYNYFNAKNQAAFQDALRRAKDKSLSQEERDAAFKEAQAILKDQEEITNTYKFRTIDAMKKMIAERNGLNPDDISIDSIEQMFKVDASMNSDEMKADYSATYKEYQNKLTALNKKYSTKTVQDVDALGNVVYKKVVERTSEYNAELQKLNQTYADAMIYDTMLVKMGDNQLQNIMNLGNASSNAERNLASMNNSLLEISNQKVDVQFKVNPEIPKDSLADIEQQIQDIKAKLKLAVDNNSRIQLNSQLKTLEEKKRVIEFQYKYPNAPELTINTSNLTQSASLEDLKNFKIPKIEKPINKRDIDLNNEYAESLSVIASIMGNISNVTKDGASAWLTWGANLLTSIAAAIPAIQTMVAAKTAEGAASAGAEAAKTPLVGWLLVGGAIAAALAAFASIPAFANGGIFQSYLTTGDKNLARLNGGEMILNKGQQANLFNLLDKGTPLGNGGNVTFKIEGKQLVGVLNNYNNKRSKVL